MHLQQLMRIHAIGCETSSTRLEEAGGRYLSRQDVKNAGRAWRVSNPDFRAASAKADWQLQLSETIEKLHELKYRTKSIQVKTQDGRTFSGLVFASTRGLQSLSQRCHLMLMDSTHNTNSLPLQLQASLINTSHVPRRQKLIFGDATFLNWKIYLAHLSYLTRFSNSLQLSAALHVNVSSRVNNCLFYQMQQSDLKTGNAIANSGLAINCRAVIFSRLIYFFT